MSRTIAVGDTIDIEVFHELPSVVPPNDTEQILMFQNRLPRRAEPGAVAEVMIKAITDNQLQVPNAVPNWSETEW